jgi:hypothetical protein
LKIISATFELKSEAGDDFDAASQLLKLLEQIGFAGPVNITNIPSWVDSDNQSLWIEPIEP